MDRGRISEPRTALLVPRAHVKRVKTALEAKGWLDRSSKITIEESDKNANQEKALRMVIPTALGSATYIGDSGEKLTEDSGDIEQAIIVELGLEDLKDVISARTLSTQPKISTPTYRGPLARALKAGLEALPDTLLPLLNLKVEAMVTAFPDSYSIYKPMLLLPHNAFTSLSWTKLLENHPANSLTLNPLWEKLANGLGVTHIATNAGIPLTKLPPNVEPTNSVLDENILRSPVNLTPIYGDFGPPVTPRRLSTPTPEDYASAFWVSHTQNGIHQIWAPLYTMFSRGNIREKTRVLNLPSVAAAIADGKGQGTSHSGTTEKRDGQNGCAAVDLYAGIGYFAFSYKKAGIDKVLCWELNPWSIEGLRRGAERNGWSTRIFKELPTDADGYEVWAKAEDKTGSDAADFLIFQQSNEYACWALASFDPGYGSRVSIPPVRHVNCGFLPSSILSWEAAVRCIDGEAGGWIHAHENVAVDRIDKKKDEVVAEMQRHLDELEAEKGSTESRRRVARWEHTEKVKTYAPGVMHVVFDVSIGGTKDVGDKP